MILFRVARHVRQEKAKIWPSKQPAGQGAVSQAGVQTLSSFLKNAKYNYGLRESSTIMQYEMDSYL